ncbi:2-acyl-glycerophospho-ethanolamine acyltransferase [compost metagenome]
MEKQNLKLNVNVNPNANVNSNANVRTFWIMVVGQFISLFGNSLLRYSLSLYILDITGSAAIYSILMALTVVPQIFVIPYGGALADRASKKLIMIALDVISGCMLLAYGLFMMHYNASVIGIGVFICVMAIIQNIYDPTVRATIPTIVKPENLSKANSITQLISTISVLLGPIAAGFVYGLYRIRFVLILDGVSFLIAALIEMFLVIPYQKRVWSGNPFVLRNWWKPFAM